MALKQFNSSEIRLSREEALRVLRYFFGASVNISPSDLTPQDVAFAQGLLVEAIDASYAMGYVHVVYDAFYAKIPANLEIGDLLKDVAKGAAKNWFRHATQKDLMTAEIYDNVRVTVAGNFRSVWKIRMDTGELTY